MPDVNPTQGPPRDAAAEAGLGDLLDGLAGRDRLELITRLRADQLRRWQAGERVPAEAYLREVPVLRDDPELAIDLIFSEFLLRRDVLREAPALDEYLARFPQHATVLRHQLELDALAREAARTEGRGDRAPATAAAPSGASDWTIVAAGGEARAEPSGAPALPGYEVLGELGRGGMGLVLRGRDLHLGRDLAVKLLHEEYQGQPHLIRRFVNEARICGRLQHPGVVPVHALGTLPDGRPFFTMKLVEGRTLADLLDRADPGQDRPRLLGVFEQVCQAVAYAHSKGVIHRDLKPQNVMVGAFGEVQVMDWGLAKVLGRDAEGAPPEGADNDTGGAERWLGTQLGHVLGTLPYMPPEQARGEVGRMDQRCDVFSLGAILCEILTGQPPFAVGDGAELLARVKACDHAVALARLGGCGADAELVRLAKACLAAEPSDRPRDAGVVARDLTAYLAGVQERLRTAEVEKAAAQARAAEARATAAAERRARRRALGLAAALLLLVLGGGGGLWWWQQQRQAADAAVEGLLAEAGLLLDQATHQPLTEGAKYHQALETAHKAKRLADDGGASAGARRRAADLVGHLEAEVATASRDRLLLAALLEVRGPREGPKYQKDDKGFLVALAEPSADMQFQAAFRAWDRSFDVDVLSTEEAAARLEGRPPAVRTEVIAALDEWADERRRSGTDAAMGQRVADLAQALDQGPEARRRELRDLLARGNLGRERALGALAMALRPVPIPLDTGLGADRQRLRRLAEQAGAAGEPVLGLLALARALQAGGDEPRAEGLLRAAIRARPQEVVLQHALGQMLERQRRWPEAVECYAAARAVRPELGTDLLLALVNGDRGGEGVALYEHLRAKRPGDPWLHLAYGIALGRRGRNRGAEAACREALRLQPDSAKGHYNLGLALYHQRRFREAEAALRESLRLDPDDPAAHYSLGAILGNQGRFEETEAACREALRLKPDSPEAHINLACALTERGRFREAEAACREALRLQPDSAGARNNLGNALNNQGRFPEAEAVCREALRLEPDHPGPYSNLGNALNGQGRLQEAEAAYRQAIRLKPDYALAHGNLGGVLNRQHRFREAEAACREALRLDPEQPAPHTNLGNALASQGRYEEAEAACREAVRLKPDAPVPHNDLANVLGRQGRFREAEAACREALRLRPDFPLAHRNLGFALLEQGRFEEALTELRRGQDLGGKTPGWPDPTAASVRQCQRLLELDRRLPAVLEGNAAPASVVERLEFAALCQMPCKGLHAAAARLAADAFSADPRLAADPRQPFRYNAACSAARAAAGQAADAKNLPDKVQRMLRRQALAWLRADLAAYARLAQREDSAAKEAVRQRLAHWQQDPDFASVRDQPALARLSDDERAAWRRLWDEVAALLKKLEQKEQRGS